MVRPGKCMASGAFRAVQCTYDHPAAVLGRGADRGEGASIYNSWVRWQRRELTDSYARPWQIEKAERLVETEILDLKKLRRFVSQPLSPQDT